jgi:competence protein ComEC
MRQFVLAAAVGLLALSGTASMQGQKTLDIYSIDVEGGQSTLFVSPSGESLLVDAGVPGGRDSGRVIEAAKQAGLTQIDYVVVTHYDVDHVGGVAEVAAAIPIRNFVDYGDRIPMPQAAPPQGGAGRGAQPGPQGSAPQPGEPGRGNPPGAQGSPQGGAARPPMMNAAKIDEDYAAARAKGNHLVVNAGDRIPIKGLDIQVVSSRAKVITKPLAGGGAANPLCGAYVPHPTDTTENINSIGMIIGAFDRFRMMDIADLTWNTEHDLACPSNLIGTVDLYLTTHHGLIRSGLPALVQAVSPRVVLMNNGPRKGGSVETWETLRQTKSIEDVWQLHYSVKRTASGNFEEKADPGGPDFNTPDQFIANMEEAAAHSPAYLLKVSVRPDGSFVVTNSRNGFTKEYTPRSRS